MNLSNERIDNINYKSAYWRICSNLLTQIQLLLITTMRFVLWLMFMLGLLSCKEFGRWDSRLANAFNVSSRHKPPRTMRTSPGNDQHRSVSKIEEPSSKLQPSCCKYDLGMGKNQPIKAKRHGNSQDREPMVDQERPSKGTSNVTPFDVYEACRFLNEYEATRIYPTPIESIPADSTESQGKRLATCPPSSISSKTTSMRAIPRSTSNGKQNANPHEIESTKEKLEVKSTVVSIERSNKRKTLAKVQPKRLLEDCLAILDHEKSDYTASSAKSTIWSRPDTPQLDMNSVWVEMLLHNQMAISQSKG